MEGSGAAGTSERYYVYTTYVVQCTCFVECGVRTERRATGRSALGRRKIGARSDGVAASIVPFREEKVKEKSRERTFPP